MPIYNGIEFIDESVTSILEQTFSHWELIIGINGHPLNSAVCIQAKVFESKDPRIKVVDFGTNIRGKSNTLNKMLEYCIYSYIALLDVDDIWHPKKLEIQMPFIQSGLYDVIGTRCVWFGDRAGVVPIIPVHDITNINFAQVNPIINSSSVIRKELCYWDDTWNGVEDYDLWIRLHKQHKTFYNCSEIVVKHRIHNQSAFNSKGNHNKVDALLKFHKLK